LAIYSSLGKSISHRHTGQYDGAFLLQKQS
jgi:hypothetical protein